MYFWFYYTFVVSSKGHSLTYLCTIFYLIGNIIQSGNGLIVIFFLLFSVCRVSSGSAMASSSVSQEDVENDFELSSRRSRIRTARARTVNPPSRVGKEYFGMYWGYKTWKELALNFDMLFPGDLDDSLGEMKVSESLNAGGQNCGEHDASPKPLSRTKDKRTNRNAPVRQPLADHLNRCVPEMWWGKGLWCSYQVRS